MIENKASKLAVLHVLKTSSGVLGGRVNVLQVCVLAGRQISYIFIYIFIYILIYIFILTHNGCSQINVSASTADNPPFCLIPSWQTFVCMC